MVELLEPTIRENDIDSDDNMVVHLYDMTGMTRGFAACGAPMSEDRHRGIHGYVIPWQKGMLSCPICEAPLCMTCVLEAS